MSVEPNQPQPEQPQPQTPPPNRASRQNLSFAKVQAIKALRLTIQTLEGVVGKLEEEPPPPPPAPTVSVKTTPTLTPTPKAVIETTREVPPATVKPAPATPSQQWWTQLSSAWLALLRLVRSLLPASWNQQLSDPLLSGAVAAILIVAIGTILTLFPGKPREVAIVSPAPVVQPAPIKPAPTPTETLPPPAPIEPVPTPAETIPPIALEPTPTPAETLPPEAEKLPDLVAPQEPKSVEIAPLPPPTLTPEQYLIASIQKQVAEITNQFGGGLAQSIQANFIGSLLSVKVSDEWYTLSEPQQDQLATQMLQQAQLLDFSKLEIINSQGKRIARSPVIGSEMIILERRHELEANS